MQTALSTTEFSTVNFDKPNEANDFALTICKQADETGLFTSTRPTAPAYSDIRLTAKKWLREIDRRISRLTPGEAFETIGHYEMIHLIGYSRQADPRTINKYILQAFDAYIHGDKTIDQYELFFNISAGLKRGDSAYFDRPLRWYSTCLDRWHKQFRHGAAVEELDDYDTIQRVCALLDSDLWAFETTNEPRYKQQLFETHRHYLDALETSASITDDSGSAVDSKTLKALEHLLHLARLYLSQPCGQNRRQ